MFTVVDTKTGKQVDFDDDVTTPQMKTSFDNLNNGTITAGKTPNWVERNIVPNLPTGPLHPLVQTDMATNLQAASVGFQASVAPIGKPLYNILNGVLSETPWPEYPQPSMSDVEQLSKASPIPFAAGSLAGAVGPFVALEGASVAVAEKAFAAAAPHVANVPVLAGLLGKAEAFFKANATARNIAVGGARFGAASAEYGALGSINSQEQAYGDVNFGDVWHEALKQGGIGMVAGGVGGATSKALAELGSAEEVVNQIGTRFVTQAGIGYGMTTLSGGTHEDGVLNGWMFGAAGLLHTHGEYKAMRQAVLEDTINMMRWNLDNNLPNNPPGVNERIAQEKLMQHAEDAIQEAHDAIPAKDRQSIPLSDPGGKQFTDPYSPELLDYLATYLSPKAVASMSGSERLAVANGPWSRLRDLSVESGREQALFPAEEPSKRTIDSVVLPDYVRKNYRTLLTLTSKEQKSEIYRMTMEGVSSQKIADALNIDKGAVLAAQDFKINRAKVEAVDATLAEPVKAEESAKNEIAPKVEEESSKPDDTKPEEEYPSEEYPEEEPSDAGESVPEPESIDIRGAAEETPEKVVEKVRKAVVNTDKGDVDVSAVVDLARNATKAADRAPSHEERVSLTNKAVAELAKMWGIKEEDIKPGAGGWIPTGLGQFPGVKSEDVQVIQQKKLSAAVRLTEAPNGKWSFATEGTDKRDGYSGWANSPSVWDPIQYGSREAALEAGKREINTRLNIKEESSPSDKAEDLKTIGQRLEAVFPGPFASEIITQAGKLSKKKFFERMKQMFPGNDADVLNSQLAQAGYTQESVWMAINKPVKDKAKNPVDEVLASAELTKRVVKKIADEVAPKNPEEDAKTQKALQKKELDAVQKRINSRTGIIKEISLSDLRRFEELQKSLYDVQGSVIYPLIKKAYYADKYVAEVGGMNNDPHYNTYYLSNDGKIFSEAEYAPYGEDRTEHRNRMYFNTLEEAKAALQKLLPGSEVTVAEKPKFQTSDERKAEQEEFERNNESDTDEESVSLPEEENQTEPATEVKDDTKVEYAKTPEGVQKFAEDNKERILKEYGDQHGDIVSVDMMKEFFRPVGYDRSDSTMYQKEAGKLTMEYFRRKLSKVPQGDSVVLMTGGTGSGKTSTIREFSGRGILFFDLNLRNKVDNEKLVQEIIDSGHIPHIKYVLRSPYGAFIDGVLKRAIDHESPDFGRAFPIDTHIMIHKQVMDVFKYLVGKFGNKVKYDIIDNRGEIGNAGYISLDGLNKVVYPYSEIAKELKDYVTDHQDIPERIRDEFLRNEGTVVPDDTKPGEVQKEPEVGSRGKSDRQKTGSGVTPPVAIPEKKVEAPISAVKAIVSSARKSFSKLPVLEYVLVENGKMRATDLDVGIEVNTSTPNGAYEIVGKDYVRASNMDDADFPAMPEKGKEVGSIGRNEFIHALERVVPFVSDDSARHILSGVLIDGNKLVATDGRRLISIPLSASFPGQILLEKPGVVLKAMGALSGDTLKVSDNANGVTFEGDNGRVSVRKLEGDFPNYHQVVSGIHVEKQIKVDKKAALKAIKEMEPYLKRQGKDLVASVITISPDGKSLTISTQTHPEIPQKSVSIPIEVTSTSGRRPQEASGMIVLPMKIDPKQMASGSMGMNPAYLKDAINSIHGDSAYISMSGPEKPLWIGNHAEEGFISNPKFPAGGAQGKGGSIRPKRAEFTPEEQPVAEAIKNGMSEDEFVKSVPSYPVYRAGEKAGTVDGVTYYSTSKEGAESYGRTVFQENVAIKNPLDLTDLNTRTDVYNKIFGEKYAPSRPQELKDSHRSKIIQYAKDNGYDGLILPDTDKSGVNEITSIVNISGKTSSDLRTLYRQVKAKMAGGAQGKGGAYRPSRARSTDTSESPIGTDGADHPQNMGEAAGMPAPERITSANGYIQAALKEVPVARDIAWGLEKLRTAARADDERAKKFLEDINLSKEDLEAIYHYAEALEVYGEPRGEILTPEQMDKYERLVKPLQEAQKVEFNKAIQSNIPVSEELHVSRKVLGRGGIMDRLQAAVDGIRKKLTGVGQGSLLSRSAGMLKHRIMRIITDKEGNRVVVSVKNNEVTAYRNGQAEEMGPLRRDLLDPVTEWHDKKLMDGLNSFAKSLGITNERLHKLQKRSALGLSWNGMKLTQQRVATPESVYSHEIGHQIDEKYNLQGMWVDIKSVRMPKSEFATLTPEQKKAYSEKKKAENRRVADIKEELRKLADATFEGVEVTDSHKKYVRKGAEKIAHIFEGMIAAPDVVKSLAPTVYKEFVDFMSSKPELKPFLDIKRSMVMAPNTVGERNMNGVFVDKNGKVWTLGEATTREIEANTTMRYSHNIIVNELLNFNKLRQINRATEFMEKLKESPEFERIAMKLDDGLHPDDWKMTSLPQFRDYIFSPRVADVLDMFAERLHSSGDIVNVLHKINSFLRTSIFFNPLIHVPNIVVHWSVDRGTLALFNPTGYVTLAKTTSRAFEAIAKQNKDYIDMLDSGANLLYADTDGVKLSSLITDMMAKEMEGDPSLAKSISDSLGLANPVNLVKSVYKFSSQMTWFVNDLATMQRVYERMEHGMDMEAAIRETARHIPDYRIPARIFDSKDFSRLMRNSHLTMFGAYHYGALKSYGEIVKDIIGNVPAEKKVEALDKLATIGLWMIVVYPIIDQLAKNVTGNPNASFRRAGATTFPENTIKLAEGKIDRSRYIQAVVTPNVGAKSMFELLLNFDLDTMKRIARPGEPKMSLEYALRTISPVDVAQRINEGSKSVGDTLAGLAGISTPHKVYNTPAEQMAANIMRDKPGIEAQTDESRAHRIIKNNVMDALKSGDSKPLEEAIASGDISEHEADSIYKAIDEPYLVHAANTMDIDELLKVMDKANPAEMESLKEILDRKFDNIQEHGAKSPKEIERLSNEIEAFYQKHGL